MCSRCLLALALTLTVVLAGCGGDQGNKVPPTAEQQEVMDKQHAQANGPGAPGNATSGTPASHTP